MILEHLVGIDIINENCVEMRYSKDIDYEIEAEFGSEITAAFTTANARIRLMGMLQWLDKSQILYCDTDSVFFIYDETNPNHKQPSNDRKDLPDNIRFGDALASWENEFEDSKGTEWITEFVCGGAKSYSYKTNKVEIKQKGITLDYANSNIFTFDTVKEAVLNNTTITSEKRYQFSWNTKTKDIETKYMSRTFEGTIDSKRNVLPNNDTLPFGHQDNLN